MTSSSSPFTPQVVIDIIRNGGLPEAIRVKRRDASGKDPLTEAMRCVQDRREKVRRGYALSLAAILCIVVLAGVSLYDAQSRILSPRPGVEILFFFCLLGLVFCGGFAVPNIFLRNALADEFAFEVGGFGADLADMLNALSMSLITMGQIEDPAEWDRQAWDALVAQVRAVNAEQEKNPQAQSERDKFESMFHALKRFGLTRKEGWRPYFAAVRAKANEATASGSKPNVC